MTDVVNPRKTLQLPFPFKGPTCELCVCVCVCMCTSMCARRSMCVLCFVTSGDKHSLVDGRRSGHLGEVWGDLKCNKCGKPFIISG